MKRDQPTESKPDSSRDVLREIYRSDGGASSDLRRLERKPRRRRRKFLIFLALFLCIAGITALVGMSVFSPKAKFSGEQVKVSFSGAQESAAGDEFVLSVIVKNEGGVKLNNLELTVRYPDGFQFTSSTPKASNEFSNAWTLGALNKNATKTIRISGKLIGEVGTTKSFLASANYTPANFASDFLSEGTFSTRLSASVLDLAIKAPNNVTNGQSVTYEVTATNTSEREIDRVRLVLTYPDGLTDVKATPAPSDSTQWDRDVLKKGESIQVKVTGKLSGDPKSVKEFKAAIGVLDSSSAFLPQREKSALVLILAPTLNLNLTSNDHTAGYAINTHDVLPFQLHYSNDSDSDFTNVTITLTWNGKDSSGATVSLVDDGAVKSATSFVKSKDAGTIQWTKDEIPDLARIVPGKSGTINVTVPTKSGLRSIGSGMNFTLNVQAGISAENVGDTGSAYQAKSDSLAFPVTTELRLAVEGRYYSDEGGTVGSGPLPPQVGATTTYSILWYITNTLNGAKDVYLVATLPDGATFVSAETSGGNNISYDTTSREVRWRIPKVDARVGQTLPTLVGSFTVSVTPVEGDVGKTLPLVGITKLTATDAFTSASLSLSGGAVTTEIPNDTQADGKGAVVAGGTETNTNVNTNAGT